MSSGRRRRPQVAALPQAGASDRGRGTSDLAPLVFNLSRPAERVTLFTPFGVRFWDAVFDRPVSDGLRVEAWPLDRPSARRTAFVTAGGVYAFGGLPGLSEVERPDEDRPPDQSPPRSWRFVVEVRDTLRRFLPVVFTADVPYRGIFPTRTPTGSGGARLPGFYLFSAPTRPAAPNLGVVRVHLEEFTGGGARRPAAFALLEVETNGLRVYGVSDDQGRAAVLFPYPVFPATALGSPGPRAADRPHWRVTLRVRYSPAAQVRPAGTDLPDLTSVVAQPPATVWVTPPPGPGGLAGEREGELVFGEELVLHTEGESTLLVLPAGSPP